MTVAEARKYLADITLNPDDLLVADVGMPTPFWVIKLSAQPGPFKRTKIEVDEMSDAPKQAWNWDVRDPRGRII